MQDIAVKEIVKRANFPVIAAQNRSLRDSEATCLIRPIFLLTAQAEEVVDDLLGTHANAIVFARDKPVARISIQLLDRNANVRLDNLAAASVNAILK